MTDPATPESAALQASLLRVQALATDLAEQRKLAEPRDMLMQASQFTGLAARAQAPVTARNLAERAMAELFIFVALQEVRIADARTHAIAPPCDI